VPPERPRVEPTQSRYAPNEIIVKFQAHAADVLEQNLAQKTPVSRLTLSPQLDTLNTKYRAKEIKPLFKNFKKNRQRLEALRKKDKSLLTKKDKHILRRLRRAPKDAKVPDLSRIYKITFDLERGQSIGQVAAAYNESPDIEYAELNFIISIDLVPDDPYYSVQWALHNVGQDYPVSGGQEASGTVDSDIDAPEAWEIRTGSLDVIVAVVDTGVDYAHRDLQGNMWTDANGCYGHDFYNDDNDPMDDNGHGTHCAGIIAAAGNNGLDVAGVCWNAKIMVVKFLGPDGWGFTIDAIRAIYYAVDNGADVISNSWGGSGCNALQETIDYAYSQGVTVVAAAGNDDSNSPTCPAANNHVIAVAATDSADQKASFSNYGDWVDIAAPGVDVLSLRAENTDMYLGQPGYLPWDRFVPYRDPHATLYVASGTSMACPHVAGACALLLSLDETLTSDQIYDILMSTVDPIQPGICLSNGRVNLFNAACAAVPAKGQVSLDRDYHSCSSDISIALVDGDLKGAGTHPVTLTTSGGDSESVVLSEKTPAVGVFAGTISTSLGEPNVQDGIMQVAHGQIITVNYYDANDGTGNPGMDEDTATIDCQAPTISNVLVDPIGQEPKVTFQTNEPTTARALCGLICGEPNAIIGRQPNPAVSHTIALKGVSPATDYFFSVEATDAAGNITVDNNNGQCYAFTTTGPESINVPARCTTIQEAIDISWDGGTIWVADGVYTGEGNRDIDFRGRAITVRSQNGPDNCIIDCQGTRTNPHQGFYFHSGEGPNSVLDGFTITRGWAAGDGGAIKCLGSSPTITNCVLTENSVVYCGGGISNFQSTPTLTNCRFFRNVAGMWPNDLFGGGGAMANCVSRPNLTNCTFVENFGISGGGMFNEYSDPALRNCAFIGNEAYVHDGGGVWNYSSGPRLINCTFSGNSGYRGGAVFCVEDSRPTVINCIMWDDRAADGNEIALDVWSEEGPSTITVSYSDIQGGAEGVYVAGDSTVNWGSGNIDDDPNFVLPGHWDGDEYIWAWVVGDCHLLAGSPCIDAGTNNPPGGLPATDLDGYARAIDGDGDGNAVADMGAYERQDVPVFMVRPKDFFFTQKTTGPDPPQHVIEIYNIGGGPLIWQISKDCDWLQVSPEGGETTTEVDEVTLQIDAAGLVFGNYTCRLTISSDGALNSPQTVTVGLHVAGTLHVPQDYNNIQAAIDAALDGDTVVLAEGTYAGDGNRNLSFSGKAITVRSADPNDPNVVANTVIDCNGSPEEPHRAFYFESLEGPDSVLAGLTITNGYAGDTSPNGGTGGAICNVGSSPTIVCCRLVANSAVSGGGMCNTASSRPAIINCSFIGNFATGGGGLWNRDDSTLTNCIFFANSADANGGAICNFTSPTLVSCTLSDNSAGGQGGGIYNWSSDWGSPVLTNCILWENTDSNGTGEPAQIYNGTPVINYSCIQSWTGALGGTGNIDADPCFADPCTGDFHLKSEAGRWDVNSQIWVTDEITSPCIDGGDPNSDWKAELWPHGKHVNMGAYGGTPEASMSLSNVGNIADLNADDSVNYGDVKILTDAWLLQKRLLAPDLDRNGVVNLTDFAILAHYWLWQQQ
jgi:subtilisin family serine protease